MLASSWTRPSSYKNHYICVESANGDEVHPQENQLNRKPVGTQHRYPAGVTAALAALSKRHHSGSRAAC